MLSFYEFNNILEKNRQTKVTNEGLSDAAKAKLAQMHGMAKPTTVEPANTAALDKPAGDLKTNLDALSQATKRLSQSPPPTTTAPTAPTASAPVSDAKPVDSRVRRGRGKDVNDPDNKTYEMGKSKTNQMQRVSTSERGGRQMAGFADRITGFNSILGSPLYRHYAAEALADAGVDLSKFGITDPLKQRFLLAQKATGRPLDQEKEVVIEDPTVLKAVLDQVEQLFRGEREEAVSQFKSFGERLDGVMTGENKKLVAILGNEIGTPATANRAKIFDKLIMNPREFSGSWTMDSLANALQQKTTEHRIAKMQRDMVAITDPKEKQSKIAALLNKINTAENGQLSLNAIKAMILIDAVGKYNRFKVKGFDPKTQQLDVLKQVLMNPKAVVAINMSGSSDAESNNTTATDVYQGAESDKIKQADARRASLKSGLARLHGGGQQPKKESYTHDEEQWQIIETLMEHWGF